MKKIIVLGGGVDQIGLLEDLKKRGYFTVLIDYYPNPVAKPYADKHIQESTLNQDKVLNITKNEGAENIITACTDQALLTVAYVAGKLNFKTQFTYEQARNITNKLYMKTIMQDAGIPTANFVDVEVLDERVGVLNYPLMVKPADCNGSYGVKKVHDKKELECYFENAILASRTHRAIIEEYKKGIEVSVDAFILDGEVTLLMCSLINKKEVDASTSIIYQTLIPAPLSDNVLLHLKNIAHQIAVAFNLDNTPLLMQVIINDDDDINVIEFSARLGGGLKYRTIKAKTGFDVLHANVDCVLGNKIELDVFENPLYYSRSHVYIYPSVFDHVEGIDSLIVNGIIEEFLPTKTKGMKVDGYFASRDRVGSFLVKGETLEELKEKINVAVEELRVYDVGGNEVMNREIFK